MKKYLIAILVMALSLFACFHLQALELPSQPSGFVNDLAGKLTQAEILTLNAKLGNFQQEKKVSIIFVTATSVDDYGYSSLQEMGVKIFDKWKPGSQSLNSGIVVLVTGMVPPYKVRIVTGRGIEGAVPDLVAKDIIETTMKPILHGTTPGAYARGLSAGAEALMAKTANEFVKPPVAKAVKAEEELNFLALLLLFGVPCLLAVMIALYLVRRNQKRKEEAQKEAENIERARRAAAFFDQQASSRQDSFSRSRAYESSRTTYRPPNSGNTAGAFVAGAAGGAYAARKPPEVTRRKEESRPRDSDDVRSSGYGGSSGSSSSVAVDYGSSSSVSVDSGGSTAGGGGGD